MSEHNNINDFKFRLPSYGFQCRSRIQFINQIREFNIPISDDILKLSFEQCRTYVLDLILTECSKYSYYSNGDKSMEGVDLIKSIDIASILNYLIENFRNVLSRSILHAINSQMIDKIKMISQNSTVPTFITHLLKDLLELISTNKEQCDDTKLNVSGISKYIIENNTNCFKIITFIGAPSLDISSIGKVLQSNGDILYFADIGARLSHRGEIERYSRVPTRSRKEFLNEQARLLLADSIQEYINKQKGNSNTTILPMALTFINKANDVFTMFDIISKVMNENNILQNMYKIEVMYFHENLNWKTYNNTIEKCQKWRKHNSLILYLLTSYPGIKVVVFTNKKSWHFERYFLKIAKLDIIYNVEQQNQIISHIRKLLKICINPQHMQPTSFIIPNNDSIKWITFPKRYYISRKIKGQRFYMYICNYGIYMISRDFIIHQLSNECLGCDIIGDNGILLDGILSQSPISNNLNDGKYEYAFVAIDILYHKNRHVWHYTLTERNAILHNAVTNMSNSIRVNIDNVILTMNVYAIDMYYVNDESIDLLIDTNRNILTTNHSNYQCDGFVFSLSDFPYIFGENPLSFVWQLTEDICIEIDSLQLYSQAYAYQPKFDKISEAIIGITPDSFVEHIPNEFLHTCQWKDGSYWVPINIQFDKKCTQYFSSYQQMKIMICENENFSLNLMTFCAVVHNQISIYNSSGLLSQIQSTFPPIVNVDNNRPNNIHPVRRVDFDNLVNILNQFVVNGFLQRYVDSDSGLEMYNYSEGYVTNDGTSQSSITYIEYSNSDVISSITIDMCQGLILHPLSRRVVVTQFDSDIDEDCVVEGNNDLNTSKPIVQATIKYDGTLIIAFKVNSIIYASTKSSLDSDQAVWATNHIRSHDNIANEIKENWTYFFEMIGGDCFHVMHYMHEQSLVFLTAYDENGMELNYNQRMSLARRCDIAMTPVLYGDINEVSNIANIEESLLFSNGALRLCTTALPTTKKRKLVTDRDLKFESNSKKQLSSPLLWEGIVVEREYENTLTRTKIICPAWKRSRHLMMSLHPAEIWNSMRYHILSLLLNDSDMPHHAVEEIYRMVDGILTCYDKMQLICYFSDIAIFSKEKTKEFLCERCGGSSLSFSLECNGYLRSCNYTIEKESHLKDMKLWDVNKCECADYPNKYKCQYCGGFEEFTATTGVRNSTNRNMCLNCKCKIETYKDICCSDCAKLHPYGAMNKLYHGIMLYRSNIYDGIDSLAMFERYNNSSLIENIMFILKNIFGPQFAPYLMISTKKINIKASILRFYLLTVAKPSSCGLMPYYTPSIWVSNRYREAWNSEISIRHYDKMVSWEDRYENSALNYIIISRFDVVTHCIFSFLQQIEYDDGTWGIPIHLIVLPSYRIVCRLWRRNIDNLYGKDIAEWEKLRKEEIDYKEYLRAKGRRYEMLFYGMSEDDDEDYDDDDDDV